MCLCQNAASDSCTKDIHQNASKITSVFLWYHTLAKEKKKKKNLWSVTSFVLFRTTHRPNVLSKISREATEAQSHKQQRLDGHSGCPWPRLSPETRPGCSGLCEAGAGNLEDGAGAAFLGSWPLREEVSPSLYSEPLLLGSADDPCHSSSHLSPLWKASLSLPLNQLPVGTGGGAGCAANWWECCPSSPPGC